MSELISIENDIPYLQVQIYLIKKYKSGYFSNLPSYKDYKNTLQNYYNNLTRENAQQTMKTVQSLTGQLWKQQIVKEKARFSKLFKICCFVTLLSYGINTAVKDCNDEHKFSNLLNKIKIVSFSCMLGGISGAFVCGWIWVCMCIV